MALQPFRRVGTYAAGLLLATGLVGAGSLVPQADAGAASTTGGTTLYAYPTGGFSSTPTSCPQISTAGSHCDLTQALSLATGAETVALAVAGDESNSATFYVGNFTVKTSITIQPASGIVNPVIDGNDAGADKTCPTSSCSGSVFTIGNGATVTIDNVTIQNGGNSGGYGGAINVGDGYGNTGTVTVNGSTFSSDSAFGGGAIASGIHGGNGTVRITGTVFNGDTASYGAAIDSADFQGIGSLSVNTTSFINNQAGRDGGAIYSGGNYGTGVVDLASSLFDNNYAGALGGAIDDGGGDIENGANSGSADIHVGTSTFTANSAEEGGAIADGVINAQSQWAGHGLVKILRSTFAGNTVVNQAVGADIASGENASIGIAGNLFADGCYISPQTLADSGYNASADNTCIAHDPQDAPGPGDIVNTSVGTLLGQLTNNGGPVETIMPEPGNPAIGLIPIGTTSIKLRSGPGALGYVLCPTGSSTACTAGAVQPTPPNVPSVSGLSPSSGPSGTVVQVAGTNFTGATSVDFGSTPTLFGVSSTTLIYALVPTCTVGSPIDVTVTGPTGISATNSGDLFTCTQPPPVPTVTSLSQSSGPAAGGNVIEVFGSNFTGATAVHFGSTPTFYSVASSTAMYVIVPQGSAGATVDVTVTGPAGTSTPSAGDKFTYA